MPGTITIGSTAYPFDEELFSFYFGNEPDLYINAMVSSGAMAEDAYIASLIANGSNLYTLPFYNDLAESTEDNYDGLTNMTADQSTGSSQTGVVFGRMKAWKAPQFIADFTAANPMQAISARIAPWYQRKTQGRIKAITEAVLGVSSMASHSVTKATVDMNTLSDVTQEIWGDRKDMCAMAIMHSAVAQKFEDLNRANFLVHTDANGMTRALRVIDINGISCLIDDDMPKHTNEDTGAVTYDTYLYGVGAFGHASAPVSNPVETWRDPTTNGGVDFIGTRKRETIHPYGFTFTPPVAMTSSPTDVQLGDDDNWSLAFSDARGILIGKMTTPGI